MTNKNESLALSPSLCHRHLMRETVQALGFRGGDVPLWQAKLRRKVCELVGLPQPARRVALDVRTLWTRRTRYGTIEKIVFTSEPHVDVPAYLCLPHLVQPPYTAFICLQGHSTGMHNSIGVAFDDETRRIRVEGDRDFGVGCMKRGIAALCIEQRAFGYRKETAQRSIASFSGCHDAAMHALMLGRTIVGERVFDVDRGIDYLCTRADMRYDRIGVMGNSGGGTVSLFAAALLPRLAFAMPSCYFCTFEASIMSLYHCCDNYVPHLYRYAEMADIMGLFAPRPVVIVAGKEDTIFPIAGVRKGFKALQCIYRAAGSEDNCRLVVGEGGHRFYAEKGWKRMGRFLAGRG